VMELQEPFNISHRQERESAEAHRQVADSALSDVSALGPAIALRFGRFRALPRETVESL